MNEEMLRQYARLVIHIGVNLQKGQPLVIASPVDCAFFARLLVSEAYRAGAKDVILNWRDDHCVLEHWLRSYVFQFVNAFPPFPLLKNT